jgi:hypothetical protein
MKHTSPPASCSHFWGNMTGLIGFMAVIYTLRENLLLTLSPTQQGIACAAGVVLPILLYEWCVLRVQRRLLHENGIRPYVDWQRVWLKVLGLVMTCSGIGFLYWLFPEYHSGFFGPYWEFLRIAMPIVLVLALPYFAYMDRRTANPEDAYWQLGRWLCGNRGSLKRHAVAELTRQWIIKAFFLPLMFGYWLDNIQYLRFFDTGSLVSFRGWYDLSYNLLYAVDVAFAAVGYMMTFRLLDSHIRSAEPTMIGWWIALLCYSPFWQSVFVSNYFAYAERPWGDVFGGNPILYALWGSVILCMIGVYALATVALGYRFSNLTYRGLVANGPYRFTKHPAYIAKNISWWLIAMPFMVGEGWEPVRNCLLLCCVSIVYYIRARTEENHLSNYPEYVEYAQWIEAHGLFRWVGKWIPYLRYSEERAKASGSIAWWAR